MRKWLITPCWSCGKYCYFPLSEIKTQPSFGWIETRVESCPVGQPCSVFNIIKWFSENVYFLWNTQNLSESLSLFLCVPFCQRGLSVLSMQDNFKPFSSAPHCLHQPEPRSILMCVTKRNFSQNEPVALIQLTWLTSGKHCVIKAAKSK